MSSKNSHQSNVKDAEIFRQLTISIDKFIGENTGNVSNVDDFIFNANNELIKTKELIEQRYEDAITKLQNRDMELSLCKQKTNFDSEGKPIKPNCSFEKSARMRAKKQVDIAQKNISQMNEIMRYAENLVNKYDVSKESFMQLLNNKLPEAQIILQKQYKIVSEYQELKVK